MGKPGYESFDGFLAALLANIKYRERAPGSHFDGIEMLTGAQIERIIGMRFGVYQDTGARKWGTPC